MCTPYLKDMLMPTHVKIPPKAIGYARLSTDLQKREDNTFGLQRESIKQACRKRNTVLLEVYEEVGSAASDNSVQDREELQSAIRRAQEEEAMLVVAEPTRLFRNEESVRYWFAEIKVPVFSVRHGRILGRRALKKAAVAGADFAAKTRAGTSEAKRAKPIPDTSETIAARQRGQRISMINRKVKSDELAKKIAVCIQEHDAERLSHKQLADILNKKGILTPQEKNWTSVNVRRHREAAEKYLAEQLDIEGETASVRGSNTEFELGKGSEASEEKSLNTVEEDEEEILRQNPNYGMF